MAQLIFYDKDHVYEVDGVRIPSVSEILRFISREQYGSIAQYTLDVAAARGRAVHKACEQLVKTSECDATEDIAGYVRAFINFCDDHKFQYTHSELPLAFAIDYAGTIDLVGYLDGAHSIIDLKTVSAVHKTLVKAQLNAYKGAYEFNFQNRIERLYCLQLMADGKYRLYPTANDSSEFDACLALHKALAKRHGRGIIE